MSFETFDLIVNCSILSALVPLLGLIKFRALSFELKILGLLVAISFLCDAASLYLKPLFNISTNYAGTSYRLAEFILLLAIYYRMLHGRSKVGLFISLGLIFVLLFFINLLYIQKDAINSYTKVYTSLVFIFFSILYFFQLMKDLPTLHLQRLPMFWINVAVLVYFSGNFFLFLLSDYLVKVLHDNLIIYWTFHDLLNILKNLVFAIAFWQGIRKPKANSI